jgi:hypothetical protein
MSNQIRSSLYVTFLLVFAAKHLDILANRDTKSQENSYRIIDLGDTQQAV